MIDAQRSDLSKILLVACDQAYEQGIADGTSLAPLPDSSSAGDVFPNAMPSDWIDLNLSAWKVIENGRFDVPATGFGATIYGSSNPDGSVDYIVAMQGTRGPNIQDWSGNLIYGWDKWSHSSVQDLRNGFVTRLHALPGVNKIHFTGQSLGGALAEYALYEYAEQNADFDASRATLTTFNGLGTIDSLIQNRGATFDPSLVANVDTTHFWVTNDLVSHLGGGHLNGDGNEYLLDFRQATDNGFPIRRDDGSLLALDFKSAHRIEAGFYRGFNLAQATSSNGFPTDFSEAVPTPIVDLGLAELARCGTYLAWLTNQDGALSTNGEAYARAAAAILASTAFGDKKGFQALLDALADNLYASDEIDKVARISISRLAPSFLRALAASPSGIAAELAAQYAALFFEAGGGADTVQTDVAFGQRLVELIIGADIPQDITTFDLSNAAQRVGSFLSGANGLSKTEASFRTGVCIALAIELLPSAAANAAVTTAVSNVLRLATEDVPNFVVAAYREVSQALRDSVGSEAFSEALARLGQSISETFLNISGSLPASAAQSLADRVQDDIADGLAGVAKSIANAYDGLSLKFTDAFDWGTALNHQVLQEVISSLLGAARSGASIDPAFSEALGVLQSAAQLVAVRPYGSTNPFDDPSFDVEVSPVSSGNLAEGSVSTWTVHLPYEAGEGGQQIDFRLAGADVNGLSVLAGGEAVVVAADGTFTATIAEGSREAAIEIAALSDFDTDTTFTLSAALANAAGEATHVEHEEAQIALDARAETPPTTVREIRGDWAPYFDPQTGAPLFLDDGLGNIQRQPGVLNAGFGEPDNKLDGSLDADHIVTGDFEDTVYAYGGDDVIEGSDLLGSVFVGGDGNDWIEAGRYDNHAADYSEFDYLGRTVRLGEDKLYGGAGDDQIYGDRETDLPALYDPRTVATGMPGDWSSGGSGNDKVYGGAGDDVLMGGAGEDILVGGAGRDVLLGDDHFYLRPDGNFWTVVHPNFGDATPGFGAFEVGLFPVVNVLDASSGTFGLTGDPYFTYYKDSGSDDVLIGGGGKDILIGQAGADVLYGGDDDDILAGWEGNDHILGGAGDDLIAGDFGRYEHPDERLGGADQLVRPGVEAWASPSAVVDQVGNDLLEGGAGNDQIWGEGGNDDVLGGDGDDILYGDAPYLPEELHGADRIDGGAGDDTLYGGGGNDVLLGEAGSDELSGDSGDDVLDGGAGADVLAGDTGDDALHGGAGSDQLDGGAGNDTLDGANDDDVLIGGEGDDVLDGGLGDDLLQGGPGNDTYVISLGYGADRVDDNQGGTRLRFGNGITADALSATLDAATLSANVSYGFPSDSLSLSIDQVLIDGVDFADGTSWSNKQFIALIPALLSAGSEASDVLLGDENLRNDLRGLEGNDAIFGSANDDALTGGNGFDVLDGAAGGDQYFFTSDEAGIDQLSDSGISARAYLDWFYGHRGIADWEERGLHGGEYRAEQFDEENGSRLVAYFNTLTDAIDAEPFATVSLVDPLPEVAPLVTRNDASALSMLEAADVLDRDTVVFGPGLSLLDLAVSVTVDGATARDHPDQPWYGGGVLSVRWGDAGFDVDVPDVQYGFVGADLFADGVPDAETAAQWRGYRLGEGVEAFKFADGSTYSLEQLLQHATVVTNIYSFVRGSGSQAIDASEWSTIRFAADIGSSEIAAERDGSDLVFRLDDGSAEGRIGGWYADPASIPVIRFEFGDGTVLDSDSITRLGLAWQGTEGSDHLNGDSLFANGLYGFAGSDELVGGAGNDLFDGGGGDDEMFGGAGNDIYAFDFGDGSDTVDEAPEDAGSGVDTIRFGTGVTQQDVTVDRDYGNLLLNIGTDGDALNILEWFNTPGGTVEQLQFADGTVWDAAGLVGMLPGPNAPTDADDVLYGAFGNDSIGGLAGSDDIAGFAGNDDLDGGDGDDFLSGGSGNDIVRGSAGADTVEEIGPDNNFIDGGSGDDSLYDEGHSLVVGGTGADWIESYGPDSVVLFNRGDGNDAIYAYDRFTLSLGGGLTPADLALVVDGDDLVLLAGPSDSVRLTRQYESDPHAWPSITLQMFGSVHEYDFNAVIDEFRAAAGNNPSLTFGLDGVLQRHQTSFSETDALGGAIAWQYATAGSIELSDSSIFAVLSDGLGAAPQPISLLPANHSPVADHPLVALTATEDAPFVLVIPADTFSDPDPGDVLSYDAAIAGGDSLPAWLTFDPETETFSGTPANPDVGRISVRVSAADQAGASVSSVFDITVVNTNDAPIALDDTGAAREDGGPVMLSGAALLDNDIDADAGDTLSLVAADRSAAGAKVDVANGNVVYDPGSLFQALGQGASAIDSFVYTVSDLVGATASATVTMTIFGANDAPQAESDAATVSEDDITSITGNVLANDTDMDSGTALVVANPGNYAGAYGTLALRTDGSYSYELQNAGSAVQSLSEAQEVADVFPYVASDGLSSSNAVLAVTVSGKDDAPFVAMPITAQTAIEGKAFTFALPATTFADADANDSLTLSARLTDGLAIPAWLAFEPSSGEFSGAPGLNDGGDYAIRLTAIDAAGASTNTDFSLTIQDSLARGTTLTGTSSDDVLNGTSADEVLDGHEGADRLSGGAGNDILKFFPDDRWKGPSFAQDVGSPGNVSMEKLQPIAGKARSLDLFDGGAGFDTLIGTDGADALFLDDPAYASPRIVDVERINGGEGRDIVDLTSRRFQYGAVALDGGSDDDVLWSSSGNDLLTGGPGNDELAGGVGDDVYVFARGDGQDTLRDKGGTDTLAFGQGIDGDDIRLERRDGDLLVRPAQSVGDSVRVVDWFKSPANRLERIRFADGSTWDTAAIEAHLKRRTKDGDPSPPPVAGRDDRPSVRDRQASSPDDHNETQRQMPDSVPELIARYLARPFTFGDEDPLTERKPKMPSEDEIARQWMLVHRFTQGLTYLADTDTSRDVRSEWHEPALSSTRNAAPGFGFDASLGHTPVPNGFMCFVGLDEGFKHL